MQTATQQLGLGLLLSMLLITVPPMAGAYFNGLMAAYSPYSVFTGWNNSNPNTANTGLPPSVANGRGINVNATNNSNSYSSDSNRIIRPSNSNTRTQLNNNWTNSGIIRPNKDKQGDNNA